MAFLPFVRSRRVPAFALRIEANFHLTLIQLLAMISGPYQPKWERLHDTLKRVTRARLSFRNIAGVEFIDENDGSPGVRLRKRQRNPF